MEYLKLSHLFFVFIWIGSLLTTTRILPSLLKLEGSLSLWRRFYFLVDLPSMILAVFTGIALFFLKGIAIMQPWLHMKFTFVFLLILCDVGTAIVVLMKVKEGRKGLFFKILHLSVIILLVGILFSIYVLKNK